MPFLTLFDKALDISNKSLSLSLTNLASFNFNLASGRHHHWRLDKVSVHSGCRSLPRGYKKRDSHSVRINCINNRQKTKTQNI